MGDKRIKEARSSQKVNKGRKGLCKMKDTEGDGHMHGG